MAALQFDQIPSEVEIVHERNIAKQSCNVMAELKNKRQLLYERTTRCKMIQELNREKEPTNRVKTYKFICVCPQYHPCYPCKHTGNVIIDRDILTKEEHICYLATPHIHQAAQRKMPRFYHKRILLPHATARIEVLAEPKKKNLISVADEYKDILSKERLDKINKITSRNPDDVRYNDIPTALAYIAEDRRLKRVTMMKERAQCRRLRNRILKKQRRQIKKIICVIFEEMKDFLLNDQFLNDESSMLSKVILEQITEFTNRDFYNTSNLRDYQKILANNLAVWINKFIAALSICVARPEQPEKLPPPEPDTFLPISDYISLSGEGEDPYEAHEDNYIDIDEYEMEQDTENAKDTQNTQN